MHRSSENGSCVVTWHVICFMGDEFRIGTDGQQ